MDFLLIILVIIILVINNIIALKFQDIAFRKGYDSSVHSFAMCFWLGIIGYLYVIALPDLNNRQIDLNNRQIDSKNSQSEPNEPTQFMRDKAKYNKLKEMAERYKDTSFDRNLRIRTYESIIKDMQVYANNNFEDSAVKIEEYRSYLDGLQKGVYK